MDEIDIDALNETMRERGEMSPIAELDQLLEEPELYDPKNFRKWMPEAKKLWAKWTLEDTPIVIQEFELDAFFIKWGFGPLNTGTGVRVN
jgi:hypothetical protein